MKKGFILFSILSLGAWGCSGRSDPTMITIPLDVLKDKIKGGWAGQTIGCTFGGPTEFRFR